MFTDWYTHQNGWNFSLSSGLKNKAVFNSQMLLTHQPYSALTNPLEMFLGMQFFCLVLPTYVKCLQILKFYLNKYNV
jgi:hypothetical protein